jgi:hypothetical protein
MRRYYRLRKQVLPVLSVINGFDPWYVVAAFRGTQNYLLRAMRPTPRCVIWGHLASGASNTIGTQARETQEQIMAEQQLIKWGKQ